MGKEKKVIKKRGRPPKITQEELRKFETGFRMGLNNSEACAYADVPESTFYDYLKVHKDFSDKMVMWKQQPILKAKSVIYKNLDDVKNAQWYLEHKCDEFSNKQKIQSINTNIDLTDEKVINNVIDKIKDL